VDNRDILVLLVNSIILNQNSTEV